MADSGCSSAKQRDAPGRVVLVVGPSGAGKDAIINSVRDQLAGDPRFVFPSRIVTRAPSAAEENEAVAADEFEALVRRGAVALHWKAHGLHYALPASIDDDVKRGCTVVFNASRQVVNAAEARFPCAVVYIDAPLHLRAQRLAARKRERAEDIAARLERVVTDFDTDTADLVIKNSGSLTEACEALLTWLLALR